MTRSNIFSVLAAAALLLTPEAYSNQAENTTLRQRLDQQVEEYTVSSADFIDAIVKVSSDFHIPLGVEWVATPSSRDPLMRSWKRTTVGAILHAIVSTQPGHEMKVEDGIVHVVASGLIPAKEDFLNLKIELFELDHGPVDLASRKLRGIVKQKVSPPRSNGGGGVGGSLGVSPDEPNISLRLTNATVRESLDKMVLVSSRKIWIVTFPSNAGLTSTGFHRTVTLWNNSPVPDEEQPVWDLLRWGDKLGTGGP